MRGVCLRDLEYNGLSLGSRQKAVMDMSHGPDEFLASPLISTIVVSYTMPNIPPLGSLAYSSHVQPKEEESHR